VKYQHQWQQAASTGMAKNGVTIDEGGLDKQW